MLTTPIEMTQLFDMKAENIELLRGMTPNAPIGAALIGH